MASHGAHGPGGHGESASEHTPHVVAWQTYAFIYAVLLILLFATVAASRYDLGAFNIVIAMLIAIVKAACVILIFMGVKWASRLAWIWSVFGFIWLLVLFGTLGDYITREWVRLPMGW